MIRMDFRCESNLRLDSDDVPYGYFFFFFTLIQAFGTQLSKTNSESHLTPPQISPHLQLHRFLPTSREVLVIPHRWDISKSYLINSNKLIIFPSCCFTTTPNSGASGVREKPHGLWLHLASTLRQVVGK